MKYEATYVVTEKDSAQALGSGSLFVLGTPALVRMVEETAVMFSEHRVSAGETTVGTQVNLSHLKASPIGATITIVMSLVEQTERTLSFEFQAMDGATVIGTGSHERAKVNIERFLSKIQ